MRALFLCFLIEETSKNYMKKRNLFSYFKKSYSFFMYNRERVRYN